MIVYCDTLRGCPSQSRLPGTRSPHPIRKLSDASCRVDSGGESTPTCSVEAIIGHVPASGHRRFTPRRLPKVDRLLLSHPDARVSNMHSCHTPTWLHTWIRAVCGETIQRSGVLTVAEPLVTDSALCRIQPLLAQHAAAAPGLPQSSARRSLSPLAPLDLIEISSRRILLPCDTGALDAKSFTSRSGHPLRTPSANPIPLKLVGIQELRNGETCNSSARSDPQRSACDELG